MLKRTIRISTITLCIFCTFFLICTGVFAATRQASQISTTVQFTPGIQVIITAQVGDGNEQVIFNNTNTTFKDANQQEVPASPYFKTSGTTTNFTSSNEIVIKIYNHTPNNVNINSAVISLTNALGAYLETYDEQTNTAAEVPNITVATAGSVIASGDNATSEPFRIVSLYQNLDITMQIALTSD